MCEREKYKQIIARNYTEDELRTIWDETYCKQTIRTFDNIEVKFYSDNFDHAFYESTDRRIGTPKKDVLSYRRLSRIYWIKDTLEDPEAILKMGYCKKTKNYTNSRRVAIVKKDYVVVIDIYRENKAKFITAYVADNSIEKIKNGPDWK